MPVYEYRCTACDAVSSVVRPLAESANPLACDQCGAETTRIISRPAVHLSRLSKVEKLDPKYDRMVDRAMRNTTHADPDRHLRKMTPLLGGKDGGKGE